MCGLLCCARDETQYRFYAWCVFSQGVVMHHRKYTVYKTKVIWATCTSIEHLFSPVLSQTHSGSDGSSLSQAVSLFPSMALSHGKGRLHSSTGSPHALRAVTAMETDSCYRSFQWCGPLPWLSTPPPPTCHKGFSSLSSTLSFPPLYPVAVDFFWLNVRNRSQAHH